MRVGIFHPLLAEIFHSVTCHPVGFGPECRRGAVVGVNEDTIVSAGVPAPVGRSGKGKVADRIGGESPGEGALRGGPGAGLPRLGGADDRDGRVAPGRACQAFTLRGSEGLLGIEEPAGGRDDIASGYRHVHVELAILQVELARADVGLVVPSLHVIIDRDAGIPLPQLVKRPVVPHPAGAVGRHREVPLDGDLAGGVRSHGRREIHAHGGAERRAPGGVAVHGERFHRSATRKSLAGEVECGVLENQRRLMQLVGDAGRGADVLLHMEPDVEQRVGRVVVIGDGLTAREAAGGGIECGVYLVIGALLPVAGARPPRPGPDARGRHVARHELA